MRRRAGALALLILLTLSLVPRAALADVYWNDTGDRKSAIVAGYPYGDWGRCSALMEFLGFDWSTIGNDARNKLLTNSNGDNPFTLALQQTKNLQYDAQTVGNIDLSIFNVWGSIFGYSEMWDVSLPYQTYYDTVEYVRSVITGSGGSTGGESGAVDGDYYVFQGNAVYSQYSQSGYYLNGVNTKYTWFMQLANTSGYSLMPQPYTIKIPLSVLSNLESRYPHAEYDWYMEATPYNGKLYTCRVYANVVNVEMGSQNIEGFENTYIKVLHPNGSDTAYANLDDIKENYTPIDGGMVYTRTNTVSLGTWPSNNNFNHAGTNFFYLKLGGIDETPTTPTPPEPDPPVTPPVTPTPPVYVPTPIGDVTITQPDYSELTDWLKLLHRDLQAIEQQIIDSVNGLDDDLAGWFQSLSDYIGNTAEWMADELEQYWDGLESNIVMWLKRIYSRMGGTGATKPDPTTDPKGFWEWLLEQFASFFAGNVDNAVDTLGDKLQELIEFFPFSIPWDVMGILALFSASPLTPQFDMYLPVPEVVDATGHIAMHIDLTPYDGLAHTIRSIELIIFAAWLATMVPTWLNQIKVSDKL